MSGTLTISAKNLGNLAYSNFCPRCFWIKLHCRLPYQIFPSIFSHIDGYTKKVFHAYIDKHGKLPDWLSELGEVKGYEEPPHWSRYKIHDEELDVTLRGEADAIFIMKDDSYLIGDYKTSKFKGKKDSLMPIYEVQLNVYAYIGERLQYTPIKKLALIYMEPSTGDDKAADKRNLLDDGFAMEFSAHILEVELRPDKIPLLMKKAKEIYDMREPPEGNAGCKDCKYLGDLTSLGPASGKKQQRLNDF